MTGPAIFFSPHQDDETLSMGASIVQHVRSGREVIVVLMCDGSGSGVGKVYPSRDVFVAERDREFKAAVKALGAEAVIRSDRVPDTHLTVEWAKSVIEEYYEEYPDASFKTMSDKDRTNPESAESDHYLLGQALRETGIKDARYYVRSRSWGSIDGKYTKYEDIKHSLLAYAPVGWLSVRSDFEFNFVKSRNKIHD